MTPTTDRRTLLRRIGTATLTASTVALAGCSGGGGGGGQTTSPAPTDTPTSSGSDEEWVETDTVDMTDDLAFVPKRVRIPAGTTVTWTTVGSIGHTVTAYEDKIPEDAEFFASGGFDSQQAAEDGYPDEGNIPEGESYEHTFETTGRYEYYCIPHEMNGMVGSIEVV